MSAHRAPRQPGRWPIPAGILGAACITIALIVSPAAHHTADAATPTPVVVARPTLTALRPVITPLCPARPWRPLAVRPTTITGCI